MMHKVSKRSRMDEFSRMCEERRREVSRLFSNAILALAQTIEILNGKDFPRDLFDPYCDRMKAVLAPFKEMEFACWSFYCKNRPPVFDGASKESLASERRENARKEKMLLRFTDKWDAFCSLGQDKFPCAADKFEKLRQIAKKRLDQRDLEAVASVFRADSTAVFATMSEIAVCTIGTVLNSAKKDIQENSGGKSVRCRGVSCHLGQTIKNLTVLKDGQTFKIKGTAYRITSKKALEMLDKLIEAYEFDSGPVAMEAPLSSYFNRGDALALKKKYIRCADGKAALQIP